MSFKLKVLTPAGLALEDRASSVKLQTVDGEIQILPQHARYVGLLGQGALEYVSASGAATQTMNLKGGFCSFGPDGLQVLADSIA
jgi:F-type H+-transporting ATPase subunit epsilon